MVSPEQQRIEQVTAYLKRLPNIPNNTDLSSVLWNEALASRIEYVSELLVTLKTGKTDHILVNKETINPKVEHFK